jgi:hypothetical protein
MKMLVDEYWDKLSFLPVPHGSLTFVGLNEFDLRGLSRPPTLPLLLLHLHLGQLCWCKGATSLAFMGSWIYG